MVTKGIGNRRDILHASLHHYTHCAAVVAVDGTVVAVIDAAKNQVGLTVKNLGESQLHTVDGRTVARPYLYTWPFFS